MYIDQYVLESHFLRITYVCSKKNLDMVEKNSFQIRNQCPRISIKHPINLKSQTKSAFFVDQWFDIIFFSKNLIWPEIYICRKGSKLATHSPPLSLQREINKAVTGIYKEIYFFRNILNSTKITRSGQRLKFLIAINFSLHQLIDD